jgi:hypothetical protein
MSRSIAGFYTATELRPSDGLDLVVETPGYRRS